MGCSPWPHKESDATEQSEAICLQLRYPPISFFLLSQQCFVVLELGSELSECFLVPL